jgi:coatomer subunit beta
MVISSILLTLRECVGPLPLVSKSDVPPTNFRTFLLNGDYFLASCLANTVTKVVLRFLNSSGSDTTQVNTEIAQALLLLVSLLRYGQSASAVKIIDPDSYQRIMLCIRTLLDPQVSIICVLPHSFSIYAYFNA